MDTLYVLPPLFTTSVTTGLLQDQWAGCGQEQVCGSLWLGGAAPVQRLCPQEAWPQRCCHQRRLCHTHG